MIETVYPEHIQAQLDLLDEKIAEIYKKELPTKYEALIINTAELERRKKILYERVRPLLDEKVRLIENCCPKYVIRS